MLFNLEKMKAIPDQGDQDNARSLVCRYGRELSALRSDLRGDGSEADAGVLREIRIRKAKIASLGGGEPQLGAF